LEVAGIKRGSLNKVDYKTNGKPASDAPGEDMRTQLKAELERHCGPDDAGMDGVLRQCSGFEKDGRQYSFGTADIFLQKNDGTMKIKDGWIALTLGNLKKRSEIHEGI
jgi:hypothetical protein